MLFVPLESSVISPEAIFVAYTIAYNSLQIEKLDSYDAVPFLIMYTQTHTPTSTYVFAYIGLHVHTHIRIMYMSVSMGVLQAAKKNLLNRVKQQMWITKVGCMIFIEFIYFFIKLRTCRYSPPLSSWKKRVS